MEKEFEELLEEVVISQASRLINLNLYNKAILSTLPVALFATNPDYQVRSINKAAEEIFNVKESDVKGTSLFDILQFPQVIVDNLQQTLLNGSFFSNTAVNLESITGKKVIGNLYLQPLKDEEEAIQGILLTVEDQTHVHFLQNAFKHYVPSSIVKEITKNPNDLKLGGEEKELTVLFSDLVGFSTISEKYPPSEMVTILSDYFDEMTEQVFEFEGTLCEYVGDELLAFFGAPVNQPDHALRACLAALAMNRTLRNLRRKWSKTDRPELQARIGLNSGPMLVGNLGSRHRFSYGVVGDNVNLGSRLEGLCDEYGVNILTSDTTAKLVRHWVTLREIDLVRVRGRTQPERIFELVSEKSTALSHARRGSLLLYSKGLSAYRNQNWPQAIESFSNALKIKADDGPAQTMIMRSRRYQENPPPADWDTIYNHF